MSACEDCAGTGKDTCGDDCYRCHGAGVDGIYADIFSDRACLDGEFTIEDLEKVIAWLRKKHA